MAQRAMVPSYDEISGTSNMNEMLIRFRVWLLEETNPQALQQNIEVTTQWSDNAAQIKTKILNAIMAAAAANNYNSLTTANIILPTYTKG